MRACVFCTIFTLFSSAAIAQQPAAQNPPRRQAVRWIGGRDGHDRGRPRANASRTRRTSSSRSSGSRRTTRTSSIAYLASTRPRQCTSAEAEMFYVRRRRERS